MTDPTIPPALTPDQWEYVHSDSPLFRLLRMLEGGDPLSASGDEPAEAHRAVAIGNDTIPDGDARKLTHGMVDRLRDIARVSAHMATQERGTLVVESWQRRADEAAAIADALASLLPPETS